MRIKKIIFAVFISLLLVVTLSINCFAEDYERGLFSVITQNVSTGQDISYPNYKNSPYTYPIGFANYINVLDYVSSSDFKYYIDATIPDNTMYQFRLVYPPLSMGGNTQGELEEYVNEVSATLGICLTQRQYNNFVNYLVLFWGDDVVDTINSVQIINSYRPIFNITDSNGTTGQIQETIYFLKISFRLYQPIPIEDLYKSTFSINILAPNPAYNTAGNSFTYYNGLHYQFATSDLSVKTASMDDVVSEIASRLDSVNNNLLVLQGLNQEILDALRQNGYGEEVDEYIDHIKETVDKTDDALSKEQIIWDNISFGEIDIENDLNIFGEMNWLWNNWVISIVVTLCSIALISYGLFGGT